MKEASLAEARPRILVAEDDLVARRHWSVTLDGAGLDVVEAPNAESALDLALQMPLAAAVLGQQVREMPNCRLVERLAQCCNGMQMVIVGGAAGSMSGDPKITALCHPLANPFGSVDLIKAVWRAIRLGASSARAGLAADQARADDLITTMGHSQAVRQLAQDVARVAPTNMSVLVVGETGTGKELVARAIHALSPRSARPLVVADCGAVPESLLGNELFGHEKGAYTGADARQPGRFELAARGGTLFLDEIGNLPMLGQKHLLRVVEDRIVHRLGGSAPIQLDTRFIAATNDDLEGLVSANRFRADLFFRISEYMIRLLPLRHRKEDIEFLAQRCIVQANSELRRAIRGVSRGALQLLSSYDWPGNVRELRNVIRRATLIAEDVVEAEHVARWMKPRTSEAAVPSDASSKSPATGLRDMVRQATCRVERDAIFAALRSVRGNKAAAARILHIDYKTLQAKLRVHGRRAEDDYDVGA